MSPVINCSNLVTANILRRAIKYQVKSDKYCFDVYVLSCEKGEIARLIKNGNFSAAPHFCLVEQLVAPGGNVLELGAQYGMFSLRMAALGYEVVAVEACPVSAALLSLSKNVNNFRNLQLVHSAVSNNEGSVEFEQERACEFATSSSMNLQTEPMQASTVDRMLEKVRIDSIDFVKMHLARPSFLTWKGMKKLIEKHSPAIMFESNVHTLKLFNQSVESLLSTIENYGYDLFFIDGETLIPTIRGEIQYRASGDYLAVNQTHRLKIESRIVAPLSIQERIERLDNDVSTDSHKNYRLYVANTLNSLNESDRKARIVEVMLQRLRRDPDVEVRQAACSKDSDCSESAAENKSGLYIDMSRKRAISVSIPRSGHTIVMRILEDYLDDFLYCEFYTPPNCCKSIPCKKPEIDIQKTHDFDLQLVPEQDLKYIVQFRNPLFSSVSDFCLLQERSSDDDKDTVKSWLNYVIQRRDFWRSFVTKWITNRTTKNVVLVDYGVFVTQTLPTMERLLKFIRPNHIVDRPRLKEILDGYSIRAKRDLRKFKYFDPLLFYLIEISLSEEMCALGMRFECATNPEFQDMIFHADLDDYAIRLIYYVFLKRQPQKTELESMKEQFHNVHQAAHAVLSTSQFLELKSSLQAYAHPISFNDDFLFSNYAARLGSRNH